MREDYYVMDPAKAVDMVDENTICVAAILGSTYNGEFEDVKLLNDLLLEKNKQTGYIAMQININLLIQHAYLFGLTIKVNVCMLDVLLWQMGYPDSC